MYDSEKPATVSIEAEMLNDNDAVYIRLSPNTVSKTIAQHVTLCTLDLDSDGKIVGIELLAPAISEHL